MSKLSKRQKYWLYEVLALATMAPVVLLFGEDQPWWKFLVLGACFSLFHQLSKRQERYAD